MFSCFVILVTCWILLFIEVLFQSACQMNNFVFKRLTYGGYIWPTIMEKWGDGGDYVIMCVSRQVCIEWEYTRTHETVFSD